MKVKWIEQKTDYDGSQLSPHWIFKNHEILGDALIAFRGACHVPIENMVDLADVRDNKPIHSEDMLHFIGEFFGWNLNETILLERLLVSLAQQEIHFRGKHEIIRGGNDLYEQDAKLSVAIATASRTSTLIHFGINISSRNTPVKTKGLEDFSIDPISFATALLESFRHEVETVYEARSKVRAV